MKCKLCQKETNKFVDSHIISHAIHALSTRSKDTTNAKILSSNPNQPPQKSRTGVYDQFLCNPCESIFQKWEDLALKIFMDAYKLPIPTELTHIKLDNLNYRPLKLFFISILWKADASIQTMYKNVDVGPKHRELLRQMLLKQEPGDWQDYSVFLERFNSDRPSASGILSPQKAKMGDITFYTFYMAAFKVHIKCDSKKIQSNMAEFFLREKQPLLVSLIPFEGSAEHVKCLKLINQTNNLSAFRD